MLREDRRTIAKDGRYVRSSTCPGNPLARNMGIRAKLLDQPNRMPQPFLTPSVRTPQLPLLSQITQVSIPRGESFHQARMTFSDVQAALQQGTVILNAAGAHIPRLAAPTLASVDATHLPCALNLYVTAPDLRTSAPPHTDAQDVVVVQTQGRKQWQVYAPFFDEAATECSVFARGKGSDALPLYKLQEKGELLVSAVLEPGDVLFIPAGFPHTTSTVVSGGAADAAAAVDPSVHLTLGLDHHIWELDYVSARRLALRRKGIADVLEYPSGVNSLPEELRKSLLAELPLGFAAMDFDSDRMDEIVAQLHEISMQIDPESAAHIGEADWKETLVRLQQQGNELLETHRDMYLAAIEEGQKRQAEDAMRAHLNDDDAPREMTPERVQRLSLFRVKRYFDQINQSKEDLKAWSEAVVSSAAASNTDDGNWEYTMPVSVGDNVEADLGGAFFSATVTRASGGTYDVAFFDGDRETGLRREQIKLLSKPAAAPDTSKMTAKELKRWKKKQQKLANRP